MNSILKNQRTHLTSAALLFGVLATDAFLAGQARPPPIRAHTAGILAISTDTFLSSLGINTHVDQGYNAAPYVLALRYLGVRNIRDSQRNLASTIMLHEQTEIRVDLLVFDVRSSLAAAKTLAKADALLAIEGPNEPNNFPITYNGKQGGGRNASWVPIAQLQKDLYSAVKGDPELNLYPVFHVSEGGAETDNVGLQYLTIPDGAHTLLPDGTQFADCANVHNYVSGVRMGYVDNQAWQAADPTLNGSWDGLYKGYGRTWMRQFRGYSDEQLRTLPRVSTETGWDAATVEDERIQGTVLVNTYLAQFKRGWRYTFVYELGEGEGGGGHQGLFHENWTPKLAATYIHNLTTILADNEPVASPGYLDYHIVGQTPTVHDLLLQKSGGVYELVVWGERVEGTDNVTINLGSVRTKVTIYDATGGLDPIQVLTNAASIPLTISDHAMILEIN
jgi:hypothetical protein